MISKKPERTRAINVELPPALHNRLKRVAESEGRSLRKQIARFLEEAAERFEQGAAK